MPRGQIAPPKYHWMFHFTQNIFRLLVGAPEADARQPGVHRGGAVYKCSVDRQGDCQIIPFDKSGTTTARNGQETDNKSGQWLGSLVTSSGEDGTILVTLHKHTVICHIDFITNSNNFRHVHLVIFIMYLWTDKIQSEYVLLAKIISPNFDHFDLA